MGFRKTVIGQMYLQKVVFEWKGQYNPYKAVGDISCEKRPEHDAFDVTHIIPDPADFFAGLPGRFVGQEIQRHGRPAGVAVQATAKNQRPEDFGHRVVDGGGLEHAGEEVVPKALDLHIFNADQPQIDQHIQPHQKLNNAPGVLAIPGVQKDASG